MPAFPPSNPGYETAVRESFARQGFMATLGAELLRVEPGEVEIGLTATPLLTQQHGFLHAGVLAGIADSACGYAALSLAPAGSEVLAVEFKINLLRPATADRVLAVARVLRPGRTLTVSFAEIFSLAETGRQLVATMLSTVITRQGTRPD